MKWFLRFKFCARTTVAPTCCPTSVIGAKGCGATPKFNVFRDELESAVDKVGVMADDVERELSRSLAI